MNLALVVWGVVLVAIGSIMTGIGWNYDKFHIQNPKSEPIINVTSQNQSGGITALNVTVEESQPKITVEPISGSQFINGQFQSEYYLTVETSHPLNRLVIEAQGETISNMIVSPTRAGRFESTWNIKPQLAKVYVDNLIAGKYKITITSAKNERLDIRYLYE